MRALLLSVFMVFLTFGVTVPEAEAKRFGGGSSFGKSFASPKKVKPAAAPQQQKSNPTTNQAANTQPKKSGMGGMLGGLLAGGLLAALFFGGAFEGMQMMDFLLIGLLAFLAFKIFGMFRQQSQAAPSYAGGPQTSQAPVARVEPEKEQTHHFTPMSAAATQLAEPELVLPQWFNKVTFLNGAKEHFTTLQAAWDKQDWVEIATYTTEELLAQLKAERANHPADQETEVVSVMSELINFIDNQDHVVASIHFYGWIKEEAAAHPTEFSEIWHLSRDMTAENAHWYIVGIEQP